jgi:uncharacterized protein (TIRG00374 family)
MKRWHTLVIGLLISAAALYLAFRQADFGAILNEFRTARYEYLLAGVTLIVLTTVLRGWRWSILTQGRISTVDGTWLFNVGFLFNNVLPAKLGEIARAVLAGRRPQMHFTIALSSIIVERLFDMVSVVVMIAVVLVTLELPDVITAFGALMGVIAVIGIVVLAIAARYPERALRLGARSLAVLPRIDYASAFTFLKPFVEGLSAVSSLKTFVLGMVISIIAWLLSAFTTWITMLAFWDNIPLMYGVAVVAAAGLGVALPAAPAGVGPFEAAVIVVLTALGLEQDASRSFAIAIHFLTILATSGLGVIGLLREGMSFGEVARAAQSIETAQTLGSSSSAETPL